MAELARITSADVGHDWNGGGAVRRSLSVRVVYLGDYIFAGGMLLFDVFPLMDKELHRRPLEDRSLKPEVWRQNGGTLLRNRAQILGVILALGLGAMRGAAQSYVWKSVAIKGGGFVSGIITHPNAPGVIYCRTDIGGAYRWNAPSN